MITVIYRLTMQSHMTYSSCSCFACLTGPSKFDHWMFNMEPHGKERSEHLRIRIVAPHKDGLDYKKLGNSLELSYSTVARVIHGCSKTGFTQNRPRKGRSKKLSPCTVRQVQKVGLKKQTHECCQHCFRCC